MNRIYRLVWNHRTQSLVAVAENTKGRGKQGGRSTLMAAAVTSALLAMGSGSAEAADVCSGATTINAAQTAGDTCVLDASGSLVVGSSGVINGLTNRAVTLAGGVTAGSISNSGTITTGHLNSVVNGAIGIAGTLTGSITNQSGGLISRTGDGTAGGAAIEVSTSAVVTGGIVNQAGGTIDSDQFGIVLRSFAVVGGITNAGVLNSAATGIVAMTDSRVIGSVVNTGSGIINTTVSGAVGIALWAQDVTGSVRNDGGISIASSGLGMDISYGTTVAGDIANTGTITVGTGGSSGAAGIKVWGNVGGSLTNSGTISVLGTATSGTRAGILVSSSAIGGGILNSGTVTGGDVGVALRWEVAANLTNQAGGTLTGGTGVHLGILPSYSSSSSGFITPTATLAGSITNHGLISGTTGAGISVDGGTLDGSIINAAGATITGTSNGIEIKPMGWVASSSSSSFASGTEYSNVTGSITNSGTIRGDGGIGIVVESSTVDGGILNNAGGTISGANTGIKVDTNSVVTGGITNAGLISGGTKSLNLQNNTNPITAINTGTLQGDVYLGNAGNILNLNGNSARVIGNVSNVGASSTINVNGTFTSEGTFNVGTFNVANGGLFNMAHAITATTMSVAGGGTLNLGAGTRALTGDYAQAANGTLRFAVTDAATYGKLNVTGDATLANGSIVDVRLNGTPGASIDGILVAGGTLADSGVTVTDNSILYNFTASTTRNAQELDLITVKDATGLINAAGTSGNAAVLGVAGALQTMFNGTIPTGMQPVFDVLAGLSPEETNAALAQLVPAVQGASSQAGLNALHSMNKIIQARIESNQGLSSGDAPAERYMWVRAFGNWGDQKDLKGVSGFKSDTGGFVIGGDTPVNNNTRAGAAFTYARTDIKGNSAAAPSNVKVNTYELVGYGSYNIDPQTDINVQIDLGQNQATSRRLVLGGGTAQANFDSLALHGSLGLGQVMPLSSQTNVTPSVRLDYTHMRTGGYIEAGATLPGANLMVDASTYKEFIVTGDAKFAHQMSEDDKLVGNVSVGYDFLNKQAQTTSSFVGGGPSFVTSGLDVSPWLYRVGFGLIHDDKKSMEYSVRYDVETRSSGYLNQTLSAKLRWAL